MAEIAEMVAALVRGGHLRMRWVEPVTREEAGLYPEVFAPVELSEKVAELLGDKTYLEDDELVGHLLEKQMEPQLRAEELRRQGVDVDDVLVDTGAEDLGEGWVEVTCVMCRRGARIPIDAMSELRSGDAVVICPNCMRDVGK